MCWTYLWRKSWNKSNKIALRGFFLWFLLFYVLRCDIVTYSTSVWIHVRFNAVIDLFIDWSRKTFPSALGHSLPSFRVGKFYAACINFRFVQTHEKSMKFMFAVLTGVVRHDLRISRRSRQALSSRLTNWINGLKLRLERKCKEPKSN